MPSIDVWFMIALFIFGGILMILELIMPGFGVAGIAGIVSLIAGIVVGSSVLTSGQLAVVIFLVFVFIVIMVVLLYRSAIRNGRLSRLLFLRTRASKDEGYTSSKSYEDMVGRVGCIHN
jgi:membrane-bound serine protease (ClpP class)